jgi:predicted DNA-binding transcriptional regulator AlpA
MKRESSIMQDKANSRRKTAELLGVSLRTLDRIRQAPDGLRPVRLSERRIVFFDSEIESFKQRRKLAGGEQCGFVSVDIAKLRESAR